MKKQILISGLLISCLKVSSQSAAPAPPAPPAPAAQPAVPAAPIPLSPPALPAPPASPAPAAPPAPAASLAPSDARDLPPGRQNQAAASNGVFPRTNRLGSLVTNMSTMQDVASTTADQRLLLQIKARVQPLLQTSTTGAPILPVHFVLQDNVITLIGEVPSEAQRQQIVTVVERSPGVVRVVDQLRVNPLPIGSTATPGSAVGIPNKIGFGGSNSFGLALTNRVPITSNFATPGGITNAMGAITNLTPTGRTNAANPIFGTNLALPAGGQNRQELPPGLERREGLPPGLSQRTNGSPPVANP
jgi:hypothetical protein